MRLRHPKKWAGARGDEKWEQISWEEALTAVTDKLAQFKAESGAESVVFGHGTGRDFQHYLYRLAHIYMAHLIAPRQRLWHKLVVFDKREFLAIRNEIGVMNATEYENTGFFLREDG